MKQWTVMVYMAADNDLDSFALKDLHEMERLGSSGDFNVVVQIDRYGDGTKGTALRGLIDRDPDWRRFEIKSVSKLVDIGETNTGHPDTLKAFIEWAIDSYPARHNALVVWSHGSGWKPEFIYKVAEQAAGNRMATAMRNVDFAKKFESRLRRVLFRATAQRVVEEFIKTSIVPQIRPDRRPAVLGGRWEKLKILGAGPLTLMDTVDDELEMIVSRAIALDEASLGDSLDSLELEAAIAGALSTIAQKRGAPFKLDVIGFDACLMAGLEVAYQLRNACDFIIGSEEIEPGVGWRYDLLMEALAAGELPPQKFSEVAVDLYIKGLEDYKIRLVTQASFATARVGEAANAVQDLGRILATLVKANYGAVAKAEKTATRFFDTDFIDLLDFVTLLESATGTAELQQIKERIAPCIVRSRFAFPSGRQSPTGLSIYFPTKPSFDPAYQRLGLYGHVDQWVSALKAYHFFVAGRDCARGAHRSDLKNSSTLLTSAGDSGSTFDGKKLTLCPSRAIRYLAKFQRGRCPLAWASASKSGEAPGATDVLPNISNLTA